MLDKNLRKIYCEVLLAWQFKKHIYASLLRYYALLKWDGKFLFSLTFKCYFECF